MGGGRERAEGGADGGAVGGVVRVTTLNIELSNLNSFKFSFKYEIMVISLSKAKSFAICIASVGKHTS